ncbi:MAG: carbon-nitrogen hydrolase family protein [Anaerolineales bacterium]|nr:carbon-nitrogen hydrolase family protein [Anaerolineales bacterium]
MKIVLVQTAPTRGDIAANLADHVAHINRAVAAGADLVIFPELSLTGYEPALAADLAMSPADARLDAFQQLSQEHNLIIGVGLPTRGETGLHISLVLFQPDGLRRAYHKRYLHADEEPFFISGPNFPTLTVAGMNVGLAICYELSIPEHALSAHEGGAALYLASVAKTAAGMDNAGQRLSEIARQYGIPALISNSVGPSDNFIGAGRSAIWDSDGRLSQALPADRPGMLVYDSETGRTEALVA